ncbi:MAG: methyltransferase domain-containing protein [Dehalococcoidia bacterium]
MNFAQIKTQIKTLYSRQEYLTPGAAEAVQRLIDVAQPTPASLLLDLACGKGEAACEIANRTGCRVVGVDLYSLFSPEFREKVASKGLGSNVTLVRADGKRLPVLDGTFEAAYCIGGPSIVGLERCLNELARAVKPGGFVLVSDIVWRARPGTLGPEWRWFASMRQITSAEYSSLIASAGLRVDEMTVFGREAWDIYHQPMAEVARLARAGGGPEELARAEQIEADIEMEARAVNSFVDYAMFVARRA